MTRRRGPTAALAVAIVVLLGAGMAATRRADSGASPAPPTTTEAPVAVSRSGPPGTAAAPGPASTARWAVPEPGVYGYRFARTGDGAVSFDATLTVARRRGGFTETRDYRSVRVTRDRSVADDGRVVREVAFTLDSASGKATCRWSTPLVVLPAERDAGHAWTSAATCTMTVASTRADVAVESSATVRGVVTSTAGGVSTPLLRVDRDTVVRTTTAGQTTTRTSAFTEYFDVGRGLLAQSAEDAAESGPAGTTTYRIAETMLTVQPEGSR